jgi:ABC-2 type transport system ATP-binding protein
MQGRLFGIPGREAHRRAAELLDAFDLADAADRPTGGFSGGMRRRLDVAIGMVHRPGLLFLDEPTTGLDPQARARMWDEVRRLRETGTTVFLTTHYLDEADALCDRLAIIDHGRIVAEGTAAELKRAVAGDVITIGVGVDGAGDLVARLLAAQPFVREATHADGTVRLYVDDGEARLPDVLRLLDGQGVAPQALALHRPSLDDVFLRQTGRSLREEAA